MVYFCASLHLNVRLFVLALVILGGADVEGMKLLCVREGWLVFDGDSLHSNTLLYII